MSKTYLRDYKEPNFFIPKTNLDITVSDTQTDVHTTFEVTRNANNPSDTLVLDGRNIELLDVSVNGQDLSSNQYSLNITKSESGDEVGTLSIPVEADSAIIKITNRIHPETNDSCEGIYAAGDMLCSQCEAEGFRRITYALDRPDVMSEFTVTITGNKAKYPFMLCNGNKVDEWDNADGTHGVKWHDPSLKPSYLFAFVCGDLNKIADTFTTRSGRTIDLHIFADKHIDTGEMTFAMDCLKNCMKWDEDRFDREYDLDLFMIVATDKFNMGAMENKGLNIFNTTCVLGSEKTATDARLQRIDDIIAHEYFHNWSGNRVTCRDWFQLSLKEGLTVFRDAQYNSDHTSHVVKRIEDVQTLRAYQFAEDAGPNAHPIRPHFFETINNFYTMTVYEKGAEIIHMIYSMLGKDGFKKALNLYFSRHDGQAVTTEEFVKAMEDGGNIDLTKFRNWYDQGGTPTVKVTTKYDDDSKSFQITLEQSVRQIDGYDEPKPFHMPIAIGLLDSKGNNMLPNAASDVYCDGTIELKFDRQKDTWTYPVSEKPVLSFLRNFSAPVKVEMEQSDADLLHIMQYDTDGYNRWDACNRLITAELKRMVGEVQNGNAPVLDSKLIDILRGVMTDANIDHAMKRLMLTLPSEDELHGHYDVIDVDAIYTARKEARKQLATALEAELLDVFNKLDSVNEAEARTLKNQALGYLCDIDGVKYTDLAEKQFQAATNFSNELAGFNNIVYSQNDTAKQNVIDAYLQKWSSNTDVMNSWFTTQVLQDVDNVLNIAKGLMKHASFDDTNPNKLRSVIGAFCGNHNHFHKEDGSGYTFLADQIIRLNDVNPQAASRFMTPFQKIAKHNDVRKKLMVDELKRIEAHKGLSKDVSEKVTNILKSVGKA